ncbi:unnamed protein product [Closterium sp. Naga37s-1]|nr:unnamed protein product [Closterium sp. Naga37s-1]
MTVPRIRPYVVSSPLSPIAAWKVFGDGQAMGDGSLRVLPCAPPNSHASELVSPLSFPCSSLSPIAAWQVPRDGHAMEDGCLVMAMPCRMGHCESSSPCALPPSPTVLLAPLNTTCCRPCPSNTSSCRALVMAMGDGSLRVRAMRSSLSQLLASTSGSSHLPAPPSLLRPGEGNGGWVTASARHALLALPPPSAAVPPQPAAAAAAAAAAVAGQAGAQGGEESVQPATCEAPYNRRWVVSTLSLSTAAVWGAAASGATGCAAFGGADGSVRCVQLSNNFLINRHSRSKQAVITVGGFNQILSPPTQSSAEAATADTSADESSEHRFVFFRGDRGEETDGEAGQKGKGKLKKGQRDGGEEVEVEEEGESAHRADCGGGVVCGNALGCKAVAMHRVAWNANRGFQQWLASGGANGVLRCQLFRLPSDS